MTSRLPGEWIDFGDNVIRLTAHPTRPWIALVRTTREGTALVERHALDPLRLVSSTEVPHAGDALVWVGDRVALIVFIPGLATSYIDAGHDGVDVVYARGGDLPPYLDNLTAHPWGVDFCHVNWDTDVKLSFRLTAHDTSLALSDASTLEGQHWRPDNATHKVRLVGTTLELRDPLHTRPVPLPQASPERGFDVLGWIDPDHLLVIERHADFPALGPTRLWRVAWETGTVRPFATDVDASSGCIECRLSPDGANLVVVINPAAIQDATVITVIDTRTGETLVREAVDRLWLPLRWLNARVVHFSEGYRYITVQWLDTLSRAAHRFSFDLPSEPPEQPLAIEGLQVVDGRRVVLPDPWSPGRWHLSEPVLAP